MPDWTYSTVQWKPVIRTSLGEIIFFITGVLITGVLITGMFLEPVFL